jgi:hypothetical protein
MGTAKACSCMCTRKRDRYKPGELVPLLRIKLLCGLERALREMQAIWTYLNDSPEFVKAKTQP